METRHLVGGSEGGVLDRLLRSLLRIVRVRILGVEARSEVNLEAIDDLVVELDVGEEGVRVVPALGKGKPVFAVGVLGLDVAEDGALGGLVAGDLEDDVGGRRGLHLEEGVADGEVLAQEVERGLSKVLCSKLLIVRIPPSLSSSSSTAKLAHLPGGGYRLRN